MRKFIKKIPRILSVLIILATISGLVSARILAVEERSVGGIIEEGKIIVELNKADAADRIIINLFPGDLYFAEQFVGYNFVHPGLKFTGDFIIINNTGQKYRVSGFSFEGKTEYISRVYNDAAADKYGVMTEDKKNIVANLSDEDWYKLNAEYYGTDNLYDLDIARKIFGYGDLSQGPNIGLETSPEFIALGEWYLFNKSQFSFDTDKYPVNNLDVKNITIQDYIDETDGNIDLVLNNCFPGEIGEDGFASAIGYSIDYSSVGNAYKWANSDFKFTLTLSRIKEGIGVTYNGNGNTGGTAPADDNLYEADSPVTVLGNTGSLVKDGFEFDGWNTSPDGGGTHYRAGDTFSINNDITLYAFWTPISEPPPEVTEPGKPETTDPGTPPTNSEDFIHINYIYGYPDGSVRPDDSITRSETVSIFFRLLTDSIKNDNYPTVFDDIHEDAWYSQAVSYLAYKGVVKGYADGTFRPDAPITRAEFAAAASRFDDLAETDENVFSDVPEDHWAVKYINSAYKKGWINGYDDQTFKPEQNITRAEVVKLVNVMFNRLVKTEDLNDSLNPFSDLSKAHWGFAHILEASLKHFYIRNDDGTEFWYRK